VVAATDGGSSSGSSASTVTSARPRKSKRATASAGAAPTASATARANSATCRLVAAWCGRLVLVKCVIRPPSNSTGSAAASR